MKTWPKRWLIALCTLWSVTWASAEPVTTMPVQMYGLGPLTCAVYSPDGRYILTGGRAGAFLWDMETSSVVRAFIGHTAKVNAVAFSPDGTKVLTGSNDRSARLWNISDGTLLRTFSQGGIVTSVAFSPDGTKVLTPSGNVAKLWNVADGALLQTFAGHTEIVSSAAFSPDGTKVLTGSYDRTAKLWNAEDGSEILTLFDETGSGMYSVAFSPDGTKLLTGSYDYTGAVCKLWSAGDGSLLRAFLATGLAVSPVSSSASSTSAKHAARRFPPRPFYAAKSVTFSPDGTKVLAGIDYFSYYLPPLFGKAMLWNASNGSLLRTFDHSRPVESVAFSPDGKRILTGSQDGAVRLWDTAGTLIRAFYSGEYACPVAFSPDGAKVLISGGSRARLYNVADGTLIRTFSGHTAILSAVAFSPVGTKVLTGSYDKTAKLWNVADGTLIRTFSGHTAILPAVAFSPDGTKVLTGSCDDSAKLWDALAGTVIRTFYGHARAVTSVAFSPDGTKILTGSSDETAKLWNVPDGALLTTFTHTRRVNSVAFSPDGTKVLTGSYDETAKLWNASDGTLLRTFSGHGGSVYSVAFSPDGTKVLTGNYDRTAKLWNTSDGALLRTFFGHTYLVPSVAFSPDGIKVLTGNQDGTARLWHAVSSPTSPAVVNAADKVIVVAGGGDYAGNPIGPQTQALADRAYFTFIVRGCQADEIAYLSAFDDWQTHDATGDGLPDVDAPATTETFWSAIDDWSSDTARLIVFLIGYGAYDTNTGEYFFRLNAGTWISASELDAHLDDLQVRTGGEVVLIVDSCFSGGFVRECDATSPTRRVVISSTTDKSVAIYSPPAGAESFSFYFLSSAIQGNTLYDCFLQTHKSFALMGFPAGQMPLMDDNGDGRSDTNDGDLASRHIIGRYPLFAMAAPTIRGVAPTHAVAPGDPVELWAQLDAATSATEVWAIVAPRAAVYDPHEPVTNLTRVDLAFNAANDRWEASWTPDLSHLGRCTVAYFAMNVDPLNSRLVSTPVALRLDVHATSARSSWRLYP